MESKEDKIVVKNDLKSEDKNVSVSPLDGLLFNDPSILGYSTYDTQNNKETTGIKSLNIQVKKCEYCNESGLDKYIIKCNECHKMFHKKCMNTMNTCLKCLPSKQNNGLLKRKSDEFSLNNTLCNDILQYYIDSRPNIKENNVKIYWLECLNNIVNKSFSINGINIHLFGSITNDLDMKGCDVDVCIDPYKYATYIKPNNAFMNGHKITLINAWKSKYFSAELDRDLIIYVLTILASVLKTQTWLTVDFIPTAKIPIIKANDIETNTTLDISCFSNNDLSVKIINTYIHWYKYRDKSIHSKILQLFIAIKLWSYKRQINNTMLNKINSIGWYLMTIKYLQQRQPSILPNLRWYLWKFHENKFNTNYGFNKYYYNSSIYKHLFYEINKNAEAQTIPNVAQLLYGFFEYYSKFNFRYNEININTTKVFSKKYFTNIAGNVYGNIPCFVLRDPVIFDNNCGKNVNIHTLNIILQQINLALYVLKNGGSWNDLLHF